MKRSIALNALLLLLCTALVGCGGKREDPILRLSAAEALEQGKEYLAQEKYFRAGQYLIHAFEVEPNSRSGREALLLAGDALFLNGGTDNYIRCEAKYRDFLNRFPTSDQADYAQFRVAECLARRVEKPDRDQKVTVKALEAFEELLRLYPTSDYIPQTRQRIREVRNLLAAHDLAVGHFHLRYGRGGQLCHGAIARLETVRDDYPDFSYMDVALFYLGVAYQQCRRAEDAQATWDDLQRQFPDSKFVREVSDGQTPDRVGALEKMELVEDTKKKRKKKKKRQAKQDQNDGTEALGGA